MNPLLLVDSYKLFHYSMYPEGMTKLYSNLTPRSSRLKGVNSIVVFGTQQFIKKYLIKQFNKKFFVRPWDKVKKEYLKHTGLKEDQIKHVQDLHELGYLPIVIKALEEGTSCPIGVPMLTITNTVDGYGWLVNYLETLISTGLWQATTSATIANEYRKLLEKYALETTGSIEGVQWQAHDFSMRGMSSPESAVISAMAHLTSFTGTDTVPAIYAHEKYYKAKGLIGASVPATEHSVMCMGEKATEVETFRRLLKTFPTGILSVVSDTWDLWKVLTEHLVEIKDEVLARDGKLVIRPDSGDPVDIICGIDTSKAEDTRPFMSDTEIQFKINGQWKSFEEYQGVIELLWDVFGGTINSKGYKVLDPHIGAIYGDSITLERAEEICKRLKAKGFASTNIVFGVGSFTYQYNTRDTFGFAMKATWGEVNSEAREIFKDPITDDGTKRSKKGLLNVTLGKEGLVCKDQCTWKEESIGFLREVFRDSKLVKEITLDKIRDNIRK